MNIPIYTVDAFTINSQLFTGNGAAVCLLKYDDDISDKLKQQIAHEMDLSETAFVSKGWTKTSDLKDNIYTIRWFTPTQEVPICGHATQASAAVIFNTNHKHWSTNSTQIQFIAKSKLILKAVIDPDDKSITIDFDIPDCQPFDKVANPWVQDIIQHTLGPNLDPELVVDVELCTRIPYIVLRLRDGLESEEGLIYKVSPDFDNLSKVTQWETTHEQVVGVIVTQKADTNEDIDFYTRFFAPNAGVNEDPVCGTANAVLTSYWKRQFNQLGDNWEELMAKQCSQRGGHLWCKIVDKRVYLKGYPKIFVSGSISV